MTDVISILKEVALPLVLAIVGIWLPWRLKKSDQRNSARMEKFKAETDKQRAIDAENVGRVYAENWELLHCLNAQMVFIIMPHPRIANHFISVRHLVKRKGVESIEKDPRTQNIPMSNVAKLTGMLINEVFWSRTDLEAQDQMAQAIMLTFNLEQAFGHKLVNSDGIWVGAVVACNLDTQLTKCEIRDILERSAKIIGACLPDIPQSK